MTITNTSAWTLDEVARHFRAGGILDYNAMLRFVEFYEGMTTLLEKHASEIPFDIRNHDWGKL